MVLDPFGGKGTTLVTANLLERQAIGFDISAEATLKAELLASQTLTDQATAQRPFDRLTPCLFSDMR